MSGVATLDQIYQTKPCEDTLLRMFGGPRLTNR